MTDDDKSQHTTLAEEDEENNVSTGCDHDSNVSSQSDSDQGSDTAETGEEDWIEYVNRNTRDADEVEIGNDNRFAP